VSRGGAILASLLVTLGRPGWWLLALAAFLVRGGFVLFLLPIVALPSPLAISNVVAPVIVPVALGRVGLEVVALLVIGLVLLLVWLVVGGAVAAATELVLVRETAAAAAEEGFGPPTADAGSAGRVRRDRVLVARILGARLVALIPLAVAIGVGVAKVVVVTYAELTRPIEVTSPLALRVALGAAPELAVVVTMWVLVELATALAARRIALDGAPAGAALLAAIADMVRHPLTTLVPWLLATGLLLTVLGGTVGAAGIAWSRLVLAMSARPTDATTVTVGLLAFVGIWLAALVLAGLFAAIRGSILTFEYTRGRTRTGTFGASAHHRPGDWSLPDEGGSL
jgi:hypothetical protein